MVEANIRMVKEARLNGRFDKTAPGLPLNWSGSGFEIKVRGSFFDIEIECEYTSLRPYVSFEVDGLRSQTFAPLKGANRYTVFCNMNPEKAHDVRVTLETQLFPNDAKISVQKVYTDGECLAPEKRACRIEFIGDSITSGEGCRGPVSFQEWLPMMFSSTDNYTRFVSDMMNAEYQAVSQSGWGVVCAWNNEERCNMPSIYDKIQAGSESYDFSFHPDYVVIALGTNDRNALSQPAFMNPVTGKAYKLTQNDMPMWTDRALSFIEFVHEKNPGAKILWVSFFGSGPIVNAIDDAVSRAREKSIPVLHEIALDLNHAVRGHMGSRQHPGVNAHRSAAKKIVKALRKSHF
ncbi:MAG: hypothetical protein IJC48_07325 [Clostridia bacterium]|nr:hypothetical protein [Clostridia bacterium]